MWGWGFGVRYGVWGWGLGGCGFEQHLGKGASNIAFSLSTNPAPSGDPSDAPPPTPPAAPSCQAAHISQPPQHHRPSPPTPPPPTPPHPTPQSSTWNMKNFDTTEKSIWLSDTIPLYRPILVRIMGSSARKIFMTNDGRMPWRIWDRCYEGGEVGWGGGGGGGLRGACSADQRRLLV